MCYNSIIILYNYKNINDAIIIIYFNIEYV